MPFYYIDQTIRDEHGVRPKHYEQILKLYSKYYDEASAGKQPEERPPPLQITIHYTEDLREACIETNIELDKVIEVPKEVIKVKEKSKNFTK